MEREDFLKRLETVSPALSGSHLIPVLAHFWFTGKSLMAYNDNIAISIPCETPFKGAVPGAVLLGLLRNSTASKIEFEVRDDELRMKAARANIALGLMKQDAFVFDMPEPTNIGIPVSDELCAAIDICLASIGDDTSSSDQMGITVMSTPGALKLFSTDNATLSHVAVPVKGKGASFPKRVILSPLFCKQLIALGKGRKATLELTDKYALMLFGSNSALYGNLIDSYRPYDFQSMITHHCTDKVMRAVKPIDKPNVLKNMLERALVITEGPSRDAFARMKEITRAGQEITRITVKGGEMVMHSKSPRGEIKDVVPIKQELEASVAINPRFLKNGLDNFDKMCITDSCVVMSGDNKLYLIAGVTG